jgi:2-hydroxycyclohexanecarboxyl-CoA dehydrogenase
MQDPLNLTDTTVMVTGAGQGVGRQVALTSAAHGAHVVVNDFHGERAQAVAAEIAEAGGRALPVTCDVTDYDGVMTMADEVAERTGGVDVLVNNAGNAGPQLDAMAQPPRFWETGPEEWAPWVATNFYGVLNCTRAVLPGMIDRGRGRVISVISDAGRVGEPNLVVYGGAKAGAAGFSRGLAKAVGRYGVTVNCVALSSIRTPGVTTALENEEAVERMLKHYPLRRLGEPEDAAGLIVFLATDAASWITGQTYPVNGGYSFAV